MTDRRLFSEFLRSVRTHFYDRSFIETFTPTLVKAPGVEVYLQYFETEYLDLAGCRSNFALRSSPELAMKTLLFQGCEDIFQVSPCFRNGGEQGQWHRPEFLMLEYYQKDVGFPEFITNFVEFIKAIDRGNHFQKAPLTFSVFDLFNTIIGIELVDGDPDLAKKAIEKKFLSINQTDDFETVFFKLMLDQIEPFLARQKFAILCDYPPSQAILSRVISDRAQRFECYLDGIEICNGFDELLDVDLNKKAIASASAQRLALGYPALTVDKNFIEALEKFSQNDGQKNRQKKLCGNAVGLERLFSCLQKKLSLQSLSDLDL